MKLLLIHGRSQEDKNPAVLRHKWVSSLHAGAEAVGLELPISDEDIIFPYFGDALIDLTVEEHPEHHEHEEDIAPVSLGRDHHDDFEYRCRVLNECFDEALGFDRGLGPAEPPTQDTGPLESELVQLGIGFIENLSTRFSSRSLTAAAADVSMYVRDENIQHFIESGIAQAVADQDPVEELVVVGHSLGSIIAYRMLAAGGLLADRNVTSFITIGSPLGIRAVREALHPIGHPPGVGCWFNAFDERDAVALHPLNDKFFNIEPAIENYGGVKNDTINRHGITGYLTDRVVVTRLINALAAT